MHSRILIIELSLERYCALVLYLHILYACTCAPLEELPFPVIPFGSELHFSSVLSDLSFSLLHSRTNCCCKTFLRLLTHLFCCYFHLFRRLFLTLNTRQVEMASDTTMLKQLLKFICLFDGDNSDRGGGSNGDAHSLAKCSRSVLLARVLCFTHHISSIAQTQFLFRSFHFLLL